MSFDVAALKARWKQFATSSRGRRILKAGRVLLTVGIMGYLAYEVVRIGWQEVLRSLPTNPLFYLLFLLLYFLLPLAEVVFYRITWRFDAWKSVPAFVKKRIYNKDVLQYSGEVYFYAWARKHVGLPHTKILETIRDQNIVSSVASTMISVVLLGVFLYLGQLSITDLIGAHSTSYLVGGGLVALVLVALGVRLRKYLFSMALKTALLLFVLQCVRLVLGQGLQIAQWAVAMPEVPLRAWLTYAAVSIIISRIPIIPNRDLIFMGAGVGLSDVMQISAAGITGMLGVLVVLNKVVNLALFAVFSLFDRRSGEAVPPDEEIAQETLTLESTTDVREPEEVA